MANYTLWYNKCRRNHVTTTAVGCFAVLPLGSLRAVYGFLLVNSVANSEAVTTLSATASENLASIGCAHAVTETMLVSFLAI